MSAPVPFSDAWFDALVALVFEAGDAIRAVAEGGQLAVEEKADASPVTAADHAAEAILSAGLRRLTPTWPQRSEEQTPPAPAQRAQWSRFWLIDPLDGTKEFLAGNGEYTVNVALIEDGRPVLGLVGVPGQGRVYLGWVPAQRALCITAQGHRTVLRTRPCATPPVVVASRRHRGEALESLLHALGEAAPGLQTRAVGSALKLVVLAAGQADAYPRRGPCSEWDIAAGEAVLLAAGGQLLTFEGAPLRYNKLESDLNPDFWAVGDPAGPLATVL
ncbi:MAG: 3'(2'),5'-bisphosphate nucleotidase CysQ, partial [Gammaproteobacteria bacterium]|nr:3'(2'),5'-bisphosphate nucleotidase CysQ [Gammaproteobacteria bacterium]